MPMTFPAHQGLILPVVRRWPHSFDALALSVGAAMPDITDTILGFSINGYFKQWYGHSLVGIFTLDFVGGIAITSLLAAVAGRFWTFFRKAPANSDPTGSGNAVSRRRAPFGLLSSSVMIGILSHIGFDLISHDTNLLLYPWVENARWFPSWWYKIWFVFRPLPMFGRSYAVGIFSVMWCLLTLIGSFLFIGFLNPRGSRLKKTR